MHFRSALLASLLTATLLPGGLAAQGCAHEPITQGSGRINSAPSLEVATIPMCPNEVQVINLNPGYHTILEFPYPVARIDGGSPDVALPEIIGNKLSMKAIDVDIVETSMTVLLGDANQTVVPFLIRADSTQPSSYKITFYDPEVRHRNQVEKQIAERLSENIDRRVTNLAEEHLRDRLLHSGGAIAINKSAASDGDAGRLVFTAEAAQQMHGPDGLPRLYLRYRIDNHTLVSVEDAHVVVRVESKHRHRLFFSKTVSRQVPGVVDEKTSAHIPAGKSVRGLLTMDGVRLAPGEYLTLELNALGGKRQITLERVLVSEAR